MKNLGWIALLIVTLSVGALGIACGDSKSPSNPPPSDSSTGASSAPAASST
jgi:hypothetical protein